ncbi:peptide ABC transporter substrate-binding protein [Arthrobacter dokdonensis]|uniref:peptide ABC transporter substrate-binding protein n=1 Tax=Arthrobacter dokdonellae TaxID=2211210 RepID=UPI000DE5857E|nr:peptide ABC transporter substrate-binding protein [Arthrobacter dokdonellae]
MFSTFNNRSRATVALAAGALAAVTVLSGCSGSTGNGAADSAKDSVSYAWPVSQTPNWIMPLGTSGHTSTINTSLIDSMWTPLFAYNTSGGSMGLDKKASLAKDISYSKDGLTATVTLKDANWTDGKPVTTRDVEFWYNLVKNNKDQWANYVSGKMPDSIKKFTAVDDHTFSMTFDKAYNQEWLTSTQLALIRPMPQHAWDKSGDDGAVGNLDRSAEGAKQVFSYLAKAAGDMGGYSTNKLWKTTDGPYSLTSFDSSGKVVLTKNDKYVGDDAGHIKTINLLPFTSAGAEENALRSKSLDYGYISAASMPQKSQFEGKGYAVTPKPGWSVTYMPYNFNNPAMGKVFSQLYARQAIQKSIDQTNISKVIWNDTAQPDYGPVPQGNASNYLSDVQKNNPYPFSTTDAQKLLTAHGWTIGSDGIASCTSPGTSATDCGEGIAKGTRFEMTVLSQSGSTETDNMMNAIRSSLSKTGISFKVQAAPVNSVLAQAQACKGADPACKWQLSFFGTSGSWYFPAYPTGEKIFGTGGKSNFGSYSNAKADQLTEAAIMSNDTTAMKQYSQLLAEDLPVVWMPNPVYQVAVTSSALKGTQQDVDQIYPQRWTW